MVGLVIAIIAPLGGYWLAGRATQPLAEIIQTAARLRPSDMRKRLRVRGTGDELDQLSLTINRLSDRIGNYLDRHREFIANAAHELRSPLAAIQSSVEVALGSDRSPTEYKELLDSIMTECQQLAKLVNQLLQLAENDAGQLELPNEPVRLDEALERSMDMFRAVAEDRGIRLRTAELDPAPVPGDLTRLRQVVNNLVDNAIKYTPAGGEVTVSLRRIPERMLVELCVADTGPGIAPEDLPHVFERFYRASRARTRREQGTGLGLSICQSIVQAHGGQIRVARTGPDGTTFVVLLPTTPIEEPATLED
jgi:heavy metal sensor kinase